MGTGRSWRVRWITLCAGRSSFAWLVGAIALLPSCGPSQVGGPAATLGCDMISPAAFYADREFGQDNPPDQLEAFTRLRTFDPNETLSRYSDEDLACWSGKGDSIADYLIAARALGSTNILVADDDAGQPIAPEILGRLRRASSSRPCTTQADEDLFFCGPGLPEAQYLLARFLPETPSHRSERERLMGKAAEQGLFIATQWKVAAPVEEMHDAD